MDGRDQSRPLRHRKRRPPSGGRLLFACVDGIEPELALKMKKSNVIASEAKQPLDELVRLLGGCFGAALLAMTLALFSTCGLRRLA